MDISNKPGPGLCKVTAYLEIKASISAAEMGAIPDIISAVTHEVHQYNLGNDKTDFIGVAFPEMSKKFSGVITGNTITLIGSHKALNTLSGTETIVKLMRRRMTNRLDIQSVTMQPGEMGTAYIRDRRLDKFYGSKGNSNKIPNCTINDFINLNYDDVKLYIRQEQGIYTGQPAIISSYGFSTSSNPVFMPIARNDVLSSAA